MVDATVMSAIRAYLDQVREAGIHVNRAVLFGSHARGQGGPDSDIDLVVIASEFDPRPDRELARRLWRVRATSDSRIEPIAAGVQQWEREDGSALLELARREGVEVG